jgi:hypothetical protein
MPDIHGKTANKHHVARDLCRSSSHEKLGVSFATTTNYLIFENSVFQLTNWEMVKKLESYQSSTKYDTNSDAPYQCLKLGAPYCSIHVNTSNKAINALRNPIQQKSQASYMLGHLGNYNPPALMALAQHLKKNKSAMAYTIYWLARMRALIDTLYCQTSDPSVAPTPRQLIIWYYIHSFPCHNLNQKTVMEEAKKNEAFAQKNLDTILCLDRSTPRNYDVHWPLLNGRCSVDVGHHHPPFPCLENHKKYIEETHKEMKAHQKTTYC